MMFSSGTGFLFFFVCELCCFHTATCIAAEIVLVDRSTPEARAKVKDIVMKFIRDPTRQTHLMAFPEGQLVQKSLVCRKINLILFDIYLISI